ncbi:MAG: mercury methylation ferredoxin HgcB [Planctomycetota bacterium]|jgi:NAD-dependent dihydropyrimidine dehydrogenase PreA subunit
MAKLRYLKNVVTLELDAEKCVGCGRCSEVCPHCVFAIDRNKAQIVDYDACMECGACEKNCPVEAIFVRSGVGCAAGIIFGAFQRTKSTCDCKKSSSSSS